MRIALSLLGAALTLWFGGWVIANFQLLGRVSDTALDARGLCTSQRGGGAVTSEALVARFVEMAEHNGLDASDVSVVLGPGSGGGALGGTLSNMTAGKLKVTSSQVTVLARVRGKKWMWSVDREIESSCTLHGGLTRTGP